MAEAGLHFERLGVAGSLAGQHGRCRGIAVRNDEAGIDASGLDEDGHSPAIVGEPKADALWRRPCFRSVGRAAATTALVSASMMTFTFTQDRLPQNSLVERSRT